MGSSVDFTETEEDQRQWMRRRRQYDSVCSFQGPLGLPVLVSDDMKRRMMNPAFIPVQIRDITSIFVEKGLQLGSIFSSQINQSGHSTKADIRVDVLSWPNRTVLDIIGLAVFGYEFNSLADPEPTELNHALSTLLATEASLFARAQSMVSALRLIGGGASPKLKL